MKLITLRLSDESEQYIDKIMDLSNLTFDEIVINALRVYGAIKKQQINGKHVYIGDQHKIDHELEIP